MRVPSLFSLVAILSFVLAFVSAEIEIDEDVLVLTDDNFDEAIKAHDSLLVEFYAPWCGHCKSLAPEWAKAAKKLNSETGVAKLAKVDATEAKELAKKFSISGFPTIKYFKGGKPSEYNGGRTDSEIVNWVMKKSGPAAKAITSEADLTSAQEASDVVILGVFSSEDSAEYKAFLSYAAGDDDNTFSVTTSEAIKNKLAVSGNSIVVLKSFDEGRNDYPVASADSLGKDFEEFIAGVTVPLIQEFSQAASKKIFGSPIKVHSLFFTDKSAAHHEPTMATFRDVATSFKGRSLFVNVPSTENRVLEYFGLTAKDLPAYVLADMSSGAGLKKFPFTGTYDVASISSHITGYFAGSLVPTLKSEDVAPEDTAGPVVVLKGKSFADLVLNNNKDVLVEFYAPWCGHCKKLAPIYDELGEKFKGNSNIVIAKMDSTANEIDVKGVEVQGFPTLYFFKGDKKDTPVQYEGKREFDDLVKYIEDNAHHASAHEEL